MEWQPIETAPKDGTEIVALVSGRPYFVRWTTHGTQHAEPWWRDREGYGLTEPTHWMPLPPPPAVSSRGSTGEITTTNDLARNEKVEHPPATPSTAAKD